MFSGSEDRQPAGNGAVGGPKQIQKRDAKEMFSYSCNETLKNAVMWRLPSGGGTALPENYR
jgi:hypothetical protein